MNDRKFVERHRGLPRIVIVGGARSGKSTLAREFRAQGWPTFCGDPESEAKDIERDVTYLPEGLPISGNDGAAAWIAEHWFTMPGHWCCESWVMARALRRWVKSETASWGDVCKPFPCDRIIVLEYQYQHAITKAGQRAQAKAVFTVWNGIKHHFTEITEYR